MMHIYRTKPLHFYNIKDDHKNGISWQNVFSDSEVPRSRDTMDNEDMGDQRTQNTGLVSRIALSMSTMAPLFCSTYILFLGS